MMRASQIGGVLLALGWAGMAAARPGPAASIPAPSALCRVAILQAERAMKVPDRLLEAIATVESGRRDPVSGAVYPWPWTINVEGVGHVYETKEAAIAAVQAFQAGGARSIDVGCLQVNLMYHPNAFASLEQAFDPAVNADYGARFLLQLFGQTNAWPRAVAAYHSATPGIGADYARKVIEAWGVPLAPVGSQVVTTAAAAAGPAPATPFGAQSGRVAVLLPSGNEAIRVIPLSSPSAGAAPAGRSGPGLAPGLAYGSAPSFAPGFAPVSAPGGGASVGAGRGLDAYRAAPVSMSLRQPRAS